MVQTTHLQYPARKNSNLKETKEPKNSGTKLHEINNQPEDLDGQLALDIYQTPTEIIVLAPIGGVKMSDLHVSITEEVLTIKGKRCLEFNIPEEDYLTQECFWGDFSRSIVLPSSIDSTRINATFKDNVLKISVPRTEKSKTKLIRIKAD